LGDFDPSGFDLQRDIREKLSRYCNKPVFDADNELHLRSWLLESEQNINCVLFQRLAVVDSDFAEFDLLPLAIKKADTRARKFRAEHGDRCAELDAIPSGDLRDRIRTKIESHIDAERDEWERLQRVEEAERETLNKFIAGLEGAA
jgi:hypothetical protein